MKNKITNIVKFFRLIFIKLIKINDSPQKIALGLGVGVFLGVLPGTGPIAALFSAYMLRINKASALLGSLLFNTWASVITFLFAIKIGSCLMGLKWREVYSNSSLAFKNFHYADLFKLAIIKIMLPALVGYFVIAFCAGIFAYAFASIMLRRQFYKNNRYV